ncbi:hypothetical protein RRG08_057382 [Elysia crispata]|uniref:Uncharacterized protein n=1 Tax=Elysia crispata TaxID=231223 RepID=A0AAE1E037_9GAST|nr:hypothetical protein RRG08_057382 [Elysia crispata]
MALVRDGETNYLERVRWGGPGQECWRVDQRPLTTNYRSAGPRTQGLDHVHKGWTKAYHERRPHDTSPLRQMFYKILVSEYQSIRVSYFPKPTLKCKKRIIMTADMCLFLVYIIIILSELCWLQSDFF